MKKVLIRGPLLSQSGYGHHSRNVFQYLSKKPNIELTCQILPWGSTTFHVNPNNLNGMIGQIIEKSNDLNPPYDLTFQIQLPNEFDSSLGFTNIGVTAAVETDRCNPQWISACNSMNHIIVPSTHVKQTLLNSGQLLTPISIVPESFSDSCLKPKEQLPTLPTFETPFNFLVLGTLTGNNPNNDRKNIFFTLKWLMEEFANNKDVGIIVKTSVGRSTPIDREACTNALKQVVKEVRKGDYPKVHLLHGDMSEDEIAALYKHPQIKALVSLTRGEGFGLPILESAVSELPIIATNWSGHLDFLSHGKFINVYYQLEAIHKSRIDNKIFMDGTRWAQPSETDFKKRAQKFYHNSSIPREWAQNLAIKIKQLYGQNMIEKAYDSVIGDLL